MYSALGYDSAQQKYKKRYCIYGQVTEPSTAVASSNHIQLPLLRLHVLINLDMTGCGGSL